MEALTHQLIANSLNFMWHDALRTSHTETGERAVIVGRFFGTVNIVVCMLQFFILPHLLSQQTDEKMCI